MNFKFINYCNLLYYIMSCHVMSCHVIYHICVHIIYHMCTYHISYVYISYHTIRPKHNITYISPPNLNATDWKQLRNLRPSIVCVVAQGRLVCHDVSVKRTGTKFKDRHIQDELLFEQVQGVKRNQFNLQFC